MALGNNKLFRIKVKGINRGNLARNSSPGVTYIVSSSMDKAYNALCILYGSDPNYTDIKDFELETIELVADESNPNTCLTDTYKLIMADNFFERFTVNNKLDIQAVKDFVENENSINNNDKDDEDDDTELEENV